MNYPKQCDGIISSLLAEEADDGDDVSGPTSFTQNLQMQSINNIQHILSSSQYIEQIVEIEMKRLKANCSQEEENYVEQMLLENPIIVERRSTTTTMTPSNQQQQPSLKRSLAETSSSNINATDCSYSTAQDSMADDEVDEAFLQQQQRSDSCRRSRINNKIKKAKTKYRHKFMSNKLLQSVNVLECLEKLIDQTEGQLIKQGFSALQLMELRKVFYNDFLESE